jgi:hypothetical protein
MKKIFVIYWKERNLIPELNDYAEYEYSIETQNSIIQTILKHGLNIMLRPNMDVGKDTLLIYIDKGRFGQS